MEYYVDGSIRIYFTANNDEDAEDELDDILKHLPEGIDVDLDNIEKVGIDYDAINDERKLYEQN